MTYAKKKNILKIDLILEFQVQDQIQNINKTKKNNFKTKIYKSNQ